VTTFVIPADNRSVGSGDPPQDVNQLADVAGLFAAVLAQFAGVPGGSAIPADNASNITAVQGLLGNYTGPGLAPSGDTSGADDPANVQALITLGVTSIQLQPGTFYGNATVTATAMPFYLRGAGRRATQWNYLGSGDAFRIYRAGGYLGYPSGAVAGITINGSAAGAGACGLHLGDVFQFGLDVEATHFNGAGSIGVHLDNNRYWAEQMYGRIFVQACSTGVMFDNSANNTGSATGSFDRTNLDIYIDQQGAGDGVTFNNGAFIADGHLGIYGNFTTATTQYACLRLTGSNSGGFSGLTTCDLQIGVELDDAVHTAPYTIYFNATSNTIYACTGRLSFSFNTWTGSNAHSNSLRFQGIIAGDFNLSSSIMTQPYSSTTAMANAATISHGYAGAVYVTNSGTSYTGIIMQAGNFVGQRVTVINEGAGTLTMAASGTSAVANGTSCVIQGNAAQEFMWANSLWYQMG